jgi:hypothetical protein
LPTLSVNLYLFLAIASTFANGLSLPFSSLLIPLNSILTFATFSLLGGSPTPPYPPPYFYNSSFLFDPAFYLYPLSLLTIIVIGGCITMSLGLLFLPDIIIICCCCYCGLILYDTFIMSSLIIPPPFLLLLFGGLLPSESIVCPACFTVTKTPPGSRVVESDRELLVLKPLMWNEGG